MLENAPLYPQFIMVSVETDEAGVDTHYIGLPNNAFLIEFDGFEVVAESREGSIACSLPIRRPMNSPAGSRSGAMRRGRRSGGSQSDAN
jgi:hypothetical protein